MRWVGGSQLLKPAIGGSHDDSIYSRNLDTNASRTLVLVVLSSEEAVYQHITDVSSKAPHAPWNGFAGKRQSPFCKVSQATEASKPLRNAGPPTLSALCSAGHHEMSSENHQFCNIKVRGSRGCT